MKHKNIIEDIIKKENNYIGQKKYQLFPSTDDNITRLGGSLGNYFLFYHDQ